LTTPTAQSAPLQRRSDVSSTEQTLREEIQRLQAELRSVRAQEKPPRIGDCEVMGYYRHADHEYGRCSKPARYVVDGQKVCGVHRRRGRGWRVRIMKNAERGKAVTLKAEEVAEIAAVLAEHHPPGSVYAPEGA
jgi:hypothetical protein